jgi:hypothetical protein
MQILEMVAACDGQDEPPPELWNFFSVTLELGFFFPGGPRPTFYADLFLGGAG